MHETTPKGTDSNLDAVLNKLTVDQVRFVVNRLNFTTDKESAKEIGVSVDTVKKWKYKGAPIDEAVRLLARDGLVIAQHIRRRNLAKAMQVKVDGLDVKDNHIKQRVATEIIDWEMGKARQDIKHTGTGEDGELVVKFESNIKPDDV